MKRGTQLAGATAAVAAGPSGLWRLAAGCLMIVLLGGLAVGGLLAFAAWTATHSTSQADAPLPCPPERVAVISTPRVGTPETIPAAVEQALRAAGRQPREGGWGSEEKRDLIVSWTPGVETRVSRSSSPTRLTLGAVPTSAQVEALLGARLAPCEAAAKPTASTEAQVEAQKPAQDAPGGLAWPWERGVGTTGALGLALVTWWLAGPNLVRGGWRALWPVRLGWRRWQRAAYRRRLRQGSELPALWPEPVSPGQRWDQHPEALHDRRSHRQQIAEREPDRRKALREAIRAERLEGLGIGPAALWRRIYRAPSPDSGPGAPENEEVLK